MCGKISSEFKGDDNQRFSAGGETSGPAIAQVLARGKFFENLKDGDCLLPRWVKAV